MFFLLKGTPHSIWTLRLVDMLGQFPRAQDSSEITPTHSQITHYLTRLDTWESLFGDTRTLSAAPQSRICHSFLITSKLKVLGCSKRNTVNILHKMRRYESQKNQSLNSTNRRNITQPHPERFDLVHGKEALQKQTMLAQYFSRHHG